MGRGGKLVPRNGGKRRVRSKEKGSDGSDEDYVLGQDEGNYESSDYVSSLAGEESEEAFDFDEVSGGSQEDEEEEEEKKVVGFKSRSVIRGQRKHSVKRSHKKTKFSDDDEVDYGYDDGEFLPDGIDLVDGRVRRAARLDPDRGSSRFVEPPSRKRTRASVDYNDNEDDDNDDDDEEFTLDGIDIVEEDEDFQVKDKGHTRKRSVRRRVSVKGQKKKRKTGNKPLRKKGKRTKRRSVLRNQVNSDDDDFIANNITVKEKTKKKSRRRGKRSVVSCSDSDVLSTGSSDYEYTISEEEREVLKEASIFCGNLTTCLRSSSLSKRLHVDEVSNHQQRGSPGRKGKVKVEESRTDVGKQVCGICWSEEGKGTIRGTLNCCNHYFCFACIFEWSKVESRCPLCKQRFTTISKPASSILGIDLRTMIIRVAKRDQVYRPTEEEIRGYFDPYENVVCMECQQAGDDNLMLLCDICDSPAHTYCVGLGREVPEGNWYCEGCRPADPGSSNSLVQDPVLNQINLSSGLSTVETNREIFNQTCQGSVSVQGPSVSPRTGVVSSPRYALGGDFQAMSPVTGAGASTLSGRRRIRHRIHSLLSSNRINGGGAAMACRSEGALQATSGNVFGNSELGIGVETDEMTRRNALISESARSRFSVGGGMAEDSNSCPVQEEDAFDVGLRLLSRHGTEGPYTATLCDSAGGTLSAEDAEVMAVSGLWQLHQCTGANISHNTYSEEARFHMAKAAEEQNEAKLQLQPIVRHHLKRSSQHMDIDQGTFKDIERRSTHTILAACGLDHDRSITIPMQPPLLCPHVERQSEPINQMENCCSSCFNSFVGDVVRKVLNSRLQSFAFNR